ncbi:hypothetical protein PIB30_089793, partial [Stylosanthes scabra]|nr:hypothetical protein [Stylosanthes scabra]
MEDEEDGANMEGDDKGKGGEPTLVNFRNVVGVGVEDMMKKEWPSVEAAYEFYRMYVKCNGFGVRRGDSRKDEKVQLVRYRFFCNRSDNRWKVRKAVLQHNHEMTPIPM